MSEPNRLLDDVIALPDTARDIEQSRGHHETNRHVVVERITDQERRP